jgi:hypothetical protein
VQYLVLLWCKTPGAKPSPYGREGVMHPWVFAHGQVNRVLHHLSRYALGSMVIAAVKDIAKVGNFCLQGVSLGLGTVQGPQDAPRAYEL